MSLGKQAKVLTDNQQKAVLGCIAARRHAARNTLIFLLSVDAGLRSKEIALLDWSMITDAVGNIAGEIRLQDIAAKGNSGGVVFISKRLGDALAAYGNGNCSKVV